MTARDYILERQVQWARRRGITLIGSKGVRGRPVYTQKLDDNLFEPLLPETHKSFMGGDGGEILGSPEAPAKMQAVHSSSAIGVNVFQYWQKISQVRIIAAACGFCEDKDANPTSIEFEKQYEIDKEFPRKPNIDVVFHNEGGKTKVFAVECKFTEAYSSRSHGGVDPKYLALEHIWDGIPRILQLVEAISPDDHRFVHLHAAQLVKHMLALKRGFGKEGFRLLYLWYDTLGKEGGLHREEIAAFSEVVQADGVRFHALSFQELLVSLAREYHAAHQAYIDYVSERYL